MRRDKINTLLMKQDFMVYEQQEPRGGNKTFFKLHFNNFYRTGIKKLQSILETRH